MYAEYMKGASRIEIGRALMDRGIYTRQGKPWVDSNVKVILTNITYTGNMLFQKEYCEDPITKHRRKNYGELPQYFVEDTHEAIIPMDEWQAVQDEFKRRRDLGPFGNKSLKLSAFSTKITCGCCGKHYRHSGKRNTAGEVYYIWTCQTKSQKGASACPSKNIPEKMLQNTTAEVLGLAEFDEDAFSQQVKEVIVIGDNTLTFRFYDGHEVTAKWQSTAKTDWWTDERRMLWGERHKRKDTNPNKHLFYEFTGFIKCGCCGANYRCQSGKRKDGTPTRSWYGPKVWHSNDAYRKVIWQCNHKFDGQKCATPTLTEDEIKELFLRAANQVIDQKEQFIAIYDQVLSRSLDTTALESELSDLEAEINIAAELIEDCIKENAHVALDQDEYQKRYDALVARFDKAKARHTDVTDLIAERMARKHQIESYLKELRSREPLTEFRETDWLAMVDYIAVHSKNDIRVTFKDGTEIKA